ncbi:hypothetical protein COO60DRAFT_1530689 [Scenedesmus sp. NREL 46B-D3]|nr:hypothetical protein COO60DRAFT_1530689 [Scenedesmus sp. NREL 46B-D3]
MSNCCCTCVAWLPCMWRASLAQRVLLQHSTAAAGACCTTGCCCLCMCVAHLSCAVDDAAALVCDWWVGNWWRKTAAATGGSCVSAVLEMRLRCSRAKEGCGQCCAWRHAVCMQCRVRLAKLHACCVLLRSFRCFNFSVLDAEFQLISSLLLFALLRVVTFPYSNVAGTSCVLQALHAKHRNRHGVFFFGVFLCNPEH